MWVVHDPVWAVESVQQVQVQIGVSHAEEEHREEEQEEQWCECDLCQKKMSASRVSATTLSIETEVVSVMPPPAAALVETT